MGKFISLEGPEGSGKTTVIQYLSQRLKEDGYDVLITREPGGIEISEKIRELILDKNHHQMDAKTEALLYAASRRQHLVEKVIPALEKGKIVISDRFIDSSLAYQGVGRAIGVEEVFSINQFAIGDYMPELTLFLDVHPEIGMERVGKRGEKDRLELESMLFHQKVYEGYHDLLRAYPDRIKRVDGEQTLEQVCQDSYQQVKEFLTHEDESMV